MTTYENNGYEPGGIEVILTVMVGNLFSWIYKDYVSRIDLKGSECVLDFGSGSGNPARFLAPRLLNGGRLTCVDISSVWMGIAKKRLRKYPNVEFRLGDIGSLDIPGASQDVILIHFVLHDIPNEQRPRIMMELSRRLAPGGRLYLREPLQYISQDELRGLMGANGLSEVSSRLAEIKTQGTVYEGVFQKNGLSN